MLRTALLFTLIVLAGCASLQKEKYTFAGGEFSEITFETDAPNWWVDVDISTSEVNCEGFKSAAKLFYDAQLRAGGLSTALQKLNPLRPDENITVTQRVPANSILQIRASATTSVANIYRRCGPISTKFKTDNASKFKAYVGLKDGYCFINVTDLAGNSQIGEPMQCK